MAVLSGTVRTLCLAKTLVEDSQEEFFTWSLPAGFVVEKIVLNVSNLTGLGTAFFQLGVSARWGIRPVVNRAEFLLLPDRIIGAPNAISVAVGENVWALSDLADRRMYLEVPVWSIAEAGRQVFNLKVDNEGAANIHTICSLVPARAQELFDHHKVG